MNKKALSPLFATIALMIFAISLGYFILEFLDTQPQISTKCSEMVKYDLVYVNQQKRICVDYNESIIKFILKNDGLSKIANVKLSLIGQSVDTINLNVQVDRGSITAGEVDFNKLIGKIDQVEFKAFYNDQNLNTCPQTSLIVSDVVECPW